MQVTGFAVAGYGSAVGEVVRSMGLPGTQAANPQSLPPVLPPAVPLLLLAPLLLLLLYDSVGVTFYFSDACGVGVHVGDASTAGAQGGMVLLSATAHEQLNKAGGAGGGGLGGGGGGGCGVPLVLDMGSHVVTTRPEPVQLYMVRGAVGWSGGAAGWRGGVGGQVDGWEARGVRSGAYVGARVHAVAPCRGCCLRRLCRDT